MAGTIVPVGPPVQLQLLIGGVVTQPITNSLIIQDSGDEARGTLTASISGTVASITGRLSPWASVRVMDWETGTNHFLGYLTNWTQTRRPGGENVVEITATHISVMLDRIMVRHEVRNAESTVTRLAFFWGRYRAKAMAASLSYVQGAVGNAQAKATYHYLTLRQVFDLIIAQASSSAFYYIDNLGRLHYGITETNPAPYNIKTSSPGAGEIAPQDLEIDWDAEDFANAVYVDAGYKRAAVERLTTPTRDGSMVWANVSAPDCNTLAQSRTFGDAYLATNAHAKVRGSFTTTQGTTWTAGQRLTVTDVPSGLSAVSFYVARVTKRVLMGGANAVIESHVEFGRSRPWLRNT